jgi:hypothetical protein
MTQSPPARRAPGRLGRGPAVLAGVAGVVLAAQGCAASAPSAPSVDLAAWVHSAYVAQRRNAAAHLFAASLSALRRAGMTAEPRAVADGCGTYVAGGGLEPITDWGVTCARAVVVSVLAPGGVRDAQAVVVTALTKAGWTSWHGALIATGCHADGVLLGVHAVTQIRAGIGSASLTAWRLTCSTATRPGAPASYGPAASGCPTRPFGGWTAWAWYDHVCRPVGLISSQSARESIVISLFAVYARVDEGTSTPTVPPPPGSS